MPHIHASVVSSSYFRLTVVRAFETYQNRTKKDLFAHPLAAQLRACDSPDAILLVLQQQVQVHDLHRCGQERLTHCLEPTVNVLYTFTLALEKGVDLVRLRSRFWGYDLAFHIYLTGYLTCKTDPCGSRCAYPSMYFRPLLPTLRMAF